MSPALNAELRELVRNFIRQELEHARPGEAAPEHLLLEEAARLARVSTSTVRYWVTIGRLPSTKPGRRRVVRRADLEALLAGKAVP